MRVFFLDSGNGSLAALAALIVCGRSKFVFYYGIYQYQAVAFRLEREVLIFQRAAIQTDKAAFFTEYGSKLVHDATVNAAVVVFRSLTYFSQFEFVDFIVAEQVVQCISISTFQCSGRGHTCTQRHIACKSGIESFHFYTAFNHFAAYTENISCPAGAGSVFFVQTEFHIIFQIDGISFDCVCAIGFHFCNHTFVD